MKLLTLDECKKLELGILIKFDEFCRNYNIKYSLCYGTLIGCIRHKGFIPWDDDIDIMMTRSNYEKFKLLWNDNRYHLLTYNEKEKWYPLFSRLVDTKTICEFKKGTKYHHGVWIGLMVVDNVPDDNKVWEVNSRIMLKRMKLVNLYFETYDNRFRNIIKRVCRFFVPNRNWLQNCKTIEHIKSQYNETKTKNVGIWLGGGRWLVFPSKYIEDYEEKEFEGGMYWVIKEYDAFLRQVYGNYMELPPVEDRVPLHQFNAYQL